MSALTPAASAADIPDAPSSSTAVPPSCAADGHFSCCGCCSARRAPTATSDSSGGARSSGDRSSLLRDGAGRILVVDTHTHILPEKWPSLKDRYGYGGFVQMEHTGPGKARMFKDDGTPFRNVEDNCWSLERRIADSDACGVDVHVLSTVPVMFSYWAKPEDTLDLSMMLNDHMSRCVASNPKRFVGERRRRRAPARADIGGRSSRASRATVGRDGCSWRRQQLPLI